LPIAIPGLNKMNGKTPLSAELQPNSHSSIGSGGGNLPKQHLKHI
jgi:hypothetical protein